MALAERLAEYVRACFTGLWIQSHEHDEAIAESGQLCRREKLAAGHLGRRPWFAGHRAQPIRPWRPTAAVIRWPRFGR